MNNRAEVGSKNIDGLHRDDKKLSSHTIKEMETINAEYIKFAKKFNMTMDIATKVMTDSADSIEKLTKSNKETEDTIKEYEKNIKEMKKKYVGVNKHLADEYERYAKNQIADLEKKKKENEDKVKKDMMKESFKEESKSKEIKYLDNKYAKGNNLAKANNEYYNQLEKLKSDALDVYGEDFENNAEYKKALLNLNNEYAKEMKDAWKEDFKENHKVLSGIADGIKNTFEENKKSLQGILGPLNLIISPIKDFFGGFGLVFKFIGGGIKKLFGKSTKKNPNASDVLKSGAFGIGALYIGNILQKQFGNSENKNEIKKGILGKLMSLKESGGIIGLLKGLPSLLKTIPILGTALRGAGLLGKSAKKNLFAKGGGFGKFFKSGATKTAFKAMGPMMIVTSLIEMTIDGIKGFFKSKEWGVSKISGALGSFFGGASDGGLKNAFSSMGKWALLGAGIGSVVPVVGTIAGGLIGGAIGMILGVIGGKNLAKGFDKIGAWFKDVWWASIKEPFNKIKEIFSSDESIGKKIGKVIGEIIMYPFNATKLFFTKNKDIFLKIFKSKDIKKSINEMGTSMITKFKNGIDKIKNFSFKDMFTKLKDTIVNFGKDLWEGIKESSLGESIANIYNMLKNILNIAWNKTVEVAKLVGNWFQGVFETVKSGLIKAWNKTVEVAHFVGDWFKGVYDGIKNALINTWNKTVEVAHSIGDWFKDVFIKTMNGLKKAWTKTKEFAKLAKDKTITKSKQIKEAIGTFISSSVKAVSEKMSKMKEFAGNTWGNFKNLVSDGLDSIKDGTFLTEFVPNLLNTIKSKLLDGFNMLKESPLGKFVQDLFAKLTDGMTKFFNENPVGKWMNSYIVSPIKNAFKSIGVWFSYIGSAFEEGGIIGGVKALTAGLIKDKKTGLSQFDIYKESYMAESVDDAIIRKDGSIIKTNPQDTLVALKDIPLSLEQVRNDTAKNLDNSLSNIGNDKNLENKLTTIIDVLSKILAKDIQVNIPPQTRNDLDIIMNGGMI